MDKDKVIEMAKQCATETTDYDLYGKPITDADVLIMGVFGDLMCRIVNKAIDDYRAELLAGSGEPIGFKRDDGSLGNNANTMRVLKAGEECWEGYEFVYSAEQLIAAVQLERNACLEIADQCADADMHASMVANAIRTRCKQ